MRAGLDFELVAAQRELEIAVLAKTRHVGLLIGDRGGDDAQHLGRRGLQHAESLAVAGRLAEGVGEARNLVGEVHHVARPFLREA